MFRLFSQGDSGKDVAILYADPSTSHKIAQTLKENGHSTGEIMNRRKNGEVFVSFISATELRNPQGELIGFYGISRGDITERKRAEEALREERKTILHNLPCQPGCHQPLRPR